MSDVRRKISLTVLLLLLFTITAVAQDAIIQRGCRVGTPRPAGTALRRGAPGGQPKLVGGDFYQGDLHQLVVMTAFADRIFKGDETATLEQWNKIFNAVNFTEGSFKGSVHDYFCAQSYDQFRPVFDLVFVQVSGNAKKYASDNTDENSQYLVQDIMEVLKTRNIDWSLYDWNGDGFVNQLLIIYAGHGMNDYSGDDLIWPHQWWMSEHKKDGQKDVYCDPIPVTYDDKEYQVDCYCALAELTSKNDYGSFGTICHEYTHCFGFPDFYYVDNYGKSTSYVQGWDLMDRGNYNGGGYCPTAYSAHERWLMGWLTPIELKEATTITDMPSLSDEGKAYLIRNDGYENEYYFVENRQRTKWDASLSGNGILVFHIDYDPELWVGLDDYVNKTSRQHYLLFHANNSTTPYSYWPYPYLNNNSLTNTSTPAASLWNANSDDSKLMNKPLTNMRVTSGLAAFDFMGGATAISQQPSAKSHQTTLLYRIGPVTIVRDAAGCVRKVIQ